MITAVFDSRDDISDPFEVSSYPKPLPSASGAKPLALQDIVPSGLKDDKTGYYVFASKDGETTILDHTALNVIAPMARRVGAQNVQFYRTEYGYVSVFFDGKLAALVMPLNEKSRSLGENVRERVEKNAQLAKEELDKLFEGAVAPKDLRKVEGKAKQTGEEGAASGKPEGQGPNEGQTQGSAPTGATSVQAGTEQEEQAEGGLTDSQISTLKEVLAKQSYFGVKGPDRATYRLMLSSGRSVGSTGPLSGISVLYPWGGKDFYTPAGIITWTREEAAQEIVKMINRNLQRLSEANKLDDKQRQKQRKAFADALVKTGRASAFGDTYGIEVDAKGLAYFVTENGQSVYGERSFSDVRGAIESLVNLVYPPQTSRAWRLQQQLTADPESLRKVEKAQKAYDQKRAMNPPPRMVSGETETERRKRWRVWDDELSDVIAVGDLLFGYLFDGVLNLFFGELFSFVVAHYIFVSVRVA